MHAVKSPEMVKEYCLVKGDQNSFWKLLGARLRGNAALIEELGYNPESVSIALMKLVEDKKRVEPVDANELSQRLENHAIIENESSNQENNKESESIVNPVVDAILPEIEIPEISRNASADQRLPSGDSVHRNQTENATTVAPEEMTDSLSEKSENSDEIEEDVDDEEIETNATEGESRDSACVSPKLLLPQPNKPEQSTDAVLCQALLVGKLSQSESRC